MAVTRNLLYLYPRAWRARYGAEFLELLEEQPATPRVVVDLILGAVDARLRPQVARAGGGAATDRAVEPDVADLCGNLAMGLALIHIELVLRLVALCDVGLRDYLRKLSATTTAPGPFLVPKFLCDRSTPGYAARPLERSPIVTTGVRRPINPAGPLRARLAAHDIV